MRAHRALLVAGFSLVAAISVAVSACGSDGGTTPSDPLIDSWNATSFMAQGTDHIANGMAMVATFNSGGTYAFEFTNDMVGACNPGPDCTATGVYTHVGTQLTLDPGTADEVSLTSSIFGSTLTLTGDINGEAITVVLERV